MWYKRGRNIVRFPLLITSAEACDVNFKGITVASKNQRGNPVNFTATFIAHVVSLGIKQSFNVSMHGDLNGTK